MKFSIVYFPGFGIQDTPVKCEPRRVVMPLDAPRHQYYPYVIDDVYRCSGGCSGLSPKTYHCIAKTQNNVSGDVMDLAAANRIKRISVVNDTSCECTCVTQAEDCSENENFVEGTCSCQCKYQDEPPTPCPKRFRSVLTFYANELRVRRKGGVYGLFKILKQWGMEHLLRSSSQPLFGLFTRNDALRDEPYDEEGD